MSTGAIMQITANNRRVSGGQNNLGGESFINVTTPPGLRMPVSEIEPIHAKPPLGTGVAGKGSIAGDLSSACADFRTDTSESLGDRCREGDLRHGYMGRSICSAWSG